MHALAPEASGSAAEHREITARPVNCFTARSIARAHVSIPCSLPLETLAELTKETGKCAHRESRS
jgi:hypothetical protein